MQKRTRVAKFVKIISFNWNVKSVNVHMYIYCALYIHILCTLHIVHFTLYIVYMNIQYTINIYKYICTYVQCTIYNVQCTKNINIHCTMIVYMYIVYCTSYIVHFTLFIVHMYIWKFFVHCIFIFFVWQLLIQAVWFWRSIWQLR